MKLAMIALSFCAASFAQTIHQDQSYKIHILQKGETLSELLQAEDYTPLYGEDRWVEKILKANHLTMEQAKTIKKGRPIILPSKEILRKMKLGDEIVYSQASISHGLLGNKISKHQAIEFGFQYHLSSLKTSAGNVESKENYGLMLGYKDKNYRSIKGLAYNPELEFGVISHGTNQASEEVLSYDPTTFANGKIAFKLPASTLKFGPSFSIQAASRAEANQGDLGIRRDNTAWAGAFASKYFRIPGNIIMDLEADLQKTIYAEKNPGLESLDALRGEIAFGVNLTRDYFIKMFTTFETYQNEGIDNISATGARINYRIQ